MRAALTQMVIDKLPIPSAKVDHRDTRLKGLVLRVMPSGTKSYYCEYARGKRVWLGRADVLGVSEARESARAILADFYRGIDPIEARKVAQETARRERASAVTFVRPMMPCLAAT